MNNRDTRQRNIDQHASTYGKQCQRLHGDLLAVGRTDNCGWWGVIGGDFFSGRYLDKQMAVPPSEAQAARGG